MPLDRKTARALAASLALVAAGGTVAGAAVFHLPVLGFGPANADATARPVAGVSLPKAKKTAPVRVVKTRFVDQIVHKPAGGPASAHLSSDASQTTDPAASAATPSTTMPAVDPPDSPEAGGDDIHESDDGHEDHDGHEGEGEDGDNVDETEQSSDSAQVGP